jgi:hypothetical protein
MPSLTATVEIASSEGRIVFRLQKSNKILNNQMLEYKYFNVQKNTLPRLDSPELVREYGKQLTQALCSHDAVKLELNQFFQGSQNHSNLQFAMSTSDGEEYRWETLYDQSMFLALQRNCSVKRISPSGEPDVPPPRAFAIPVRMVAFLSPSGISSRDELKAILNAVAMAQATEDLKIELTVYLGEQNLLDETSEKITSGSLKDVFAYPMPRDAIALEQVIKDKSIQLLHFFCHGHIQDGERLLQFASINDHETMQEGSVNLAIVRLTQILNLNSSVWLTVLNSCSGAQEIPRLYSMAATLSQSASPVTIGMAEKILADDASLFASVFYHEALLMIGKAIRPLTENVLNQPVTEIDFGPAVNTARLALHEKANQGSPEMFNRWCLPVQYQGSSPLKVMYRPDPEMAERIDGIASSLRGLGRNAPIELRDKILALLDAPPSVPDSLRPDRFGNFHD